MYASRLQELCKALGLDSPVFEVRTSEKEGPDQSRLLSGTVTVKGLTFLTPWLWCKAPEEAHECAAKDALDFLTGDGASTSRATAAQPSTSSDTHRVEVLHSPGSPPSCQSPSSTSISPPQSMYVLRLHKLCQLCGLGMPVYKVRTSEKEGPDQTRLLSGTVTVKGVTFQTPWLWCKAPEEADECAAKDALEFFTGDGASTSRAMVSQPSSSTSSGSVSPMYALRLHKLCKSLGLDSPVFEVRTSSEKEGPNQSRLLAGMVTVKGLTFLTPWLWCKVPEEAHECAAKDALDFLTGSGVSTSRATAAQPSTSSESDTHKVTVPHSSGSPPSGQSPSSTSISLPQPMYVSRLHEFCQLRGLDIPAYKVRTSEKEGPDQTRLLCGTVTVKGLTFQTPWLWCKALEEAHECAAKDALEFFTGAGVSTSRAMVSQPSSSTSSGVLDVRMYKNKLQEYTQKTKLELPIYQTVNEGPQHKPEFRCTVTVQNTPYTSPQTFAQRKRAEQDAARIALESLQQIPKDETCPAASEDIALCKSILNEYAVKMHLDMPYYETVQVDGSHSVFECTVKFHGAYYTGVKGKSKKMAEQKAARFVIRIILDMGASESKKVMSRIIQSKFSSSSAPSDTKDSIFSCISATEPLPSDTVKNQAHPPLHLFKKPKLDVPSLAVVPSIEFVHSGFVEGSVAPPSGPKRKRKGKKKARGNL